MYYLLLVYDTTYYQVFLPVVTGIIRRIGVSDFELISAELVVGVGTVAERLSVVGGAFEDSTALGDVLSVAFAILFNLMPLRDGAAALVVFIEPDPSPIDVPSFITDADAVAAERLVSWAVSEPSFGTHCIERPV